LKKTKWAVVGCGKHAFSAHLPAIARAAEIELVAVCDSNEASAKRAQQTFGARRSYINHRDLLKDEDIDVVDVVVPVHAHCEVVVDSAEAGRNVICEKPMANNLEECDVMIRAARKNRVKFMVAHSRRFWNKYKQIKGIIDADTIGRVLVQKQLEVRGKDMLITQEHAYRSKTNPLGSMLGKGGHSVDLFRWFLGSSLRRVLAVGRTTKSAIYPHSDVFDHAKAMLIFENGSTAFVESNDIAPRGCPYYFPILEIIGTKGKVTASDYSMVSVIASYDEKLSIPFSSSQFLAGLGTPFLEELKYFSRCVLDDMEPNYITLEDARAVVEAAVAADRSMRKGEPVDLPL
jgi:predicted dehydrogenase